MAIVFSLIAFLLSLADAYILLNVLGNISWWIKGWLVIPTLVYWGLIIWMSLTGDTRQMVLNCVMWISLCVVLPTLIFTVFSILGTCFGYLWHPLSSVLTWAGIVLGTVWLGNALYGSIFGWRRIDVKTTDITLADLPKNFEGYKIVQLTDFHIGVYAGTPRQVEKIVEKVNSLHPDLVVFTGDLVNTSPEELPQFMKILSGFDAPDGVISVLGNHDYCIYHRYTGDDTPQKAVARVVKGEKEMGWKLLMNESVQIRRGNDSIAIIGVENAGDRHFPDKADLKKAMAGVPADECKILLSHDPSHWRREVIPDTDIPLMLAGHTHAMQFKLGNFSPSQWTYPEWGGLYSEEDQQIYVSTGIGGNIAFRFGVYPTIDLLILRN